MITLHLFTPQEMLIGSLAFIWAVVAIACIIGAMRGQR